MGGCVADYRDRRAILGQHAYPGRLEVRGHRRQLGQYRVLVGGGAVPGDGHRGGVGPAARHQHLREIGGPGLRAEDDEAAGRLELRGPAAQLGCVHDPQVRGGVAGQRQAGVGGHGRG